MSQKIGPSSQAGPGSPGGGTDSRARVTAVVVNYNGGSEVLACLRSVEASSERVEIVVVDNGSRDGSDDEIARLYPAVRLERTGRNLGFAAAANLGCRTATTAYVLFLNPDAVVGRDAIAVLAAALDERPRAAAAGALVRNPDGSVQPSKRAFPTLWEAALHGIVGIVWPGNPGTRAYTLADTDLSQPRPVDWVAANSMLVRRDAFVSVGGFDESFFFFVEDVDLCKRFHDAGLEVWFEPRAEIVHAWGTSWTRRPVRFLWLHHRNLFRYATKHRRGAWVLAYPVIAAGLLLRFVLMLLRWLAGRRAVPRHSSARGGGIG